MVSVDPRHSLKGNIQSFLLLLLLFLLLLHVRVEIEGFLGVARHSSSEANQEVSKVLLVPAFGDTESNLARQTIDEALPMD